MSGHNHTRFRNDNGPWSVCPSTCPESTSVMGELRRLREVVARVQGLAVDPAEIIRQRSHGWPDFHPEDFCHQCERPNPTWFADTDLWQAATESTGDSGGILCPSCFAALWEAKTGKTAIIWRLSIDPRSRDALSAPSPSVEQRYTETDGPAPAGAYAATEGAGDGV